jgi:DNA-binding response OmpR family regulator
MRSLFGGPPPGKHPVSTSTLDTRKPLINNRSVGGKSVANPDAFIIVVEDDRAMQRLLRRTLELAGYRVDVVGDGPSALELLETTRPDLVLLDVLLPGMDGIEVCRRVRERSQVPIVIISALGREQDKIKGLDAGADDYVTKPFSANELLARVRAVLRRSAKAAESTTFASPLQIDDLDLDPSRHLVQRNGAEISVTPLEFRLLAYLASYAGRVLTHNMILKAVWGEEYADELHMLRVNISRLRQKIERDPLKPEIIVTVPGVGYTVPSGKRAGEVSR